MKIPLYGDYDEIWEDICNYDNSAVLMRSFILDIDAVSILLPVPRNVSFIVKYEEENVKDVVLVTISWGIRKSTKKVFVAWALKNYANCLYKNEDVTRKIVSFLKF